MSDLATPNGTTSAAALRHLDTTASSTASGRVAQAARAHHPSTGVPGVVADRDLLSVLASDQRRRTAVVEIVVPVYNEEPGIEASIRRLHAYLTEEFPLPWLITVADSSVASFFARVVLPDPGKPGLRGLYTGI